MGAITRRHATVRTVVETLEAEAASVRTVVVPVQHADPVTVLAQVVAANERHAGRGLAGVLTQGPLPATLVLTGPAAEHPRWIELIARYDVPQGVVTRTYPVPAFGSEELADLLEQVARRSGPRGSGEAWKVVRNPLTGTILVTATELEHEGVAELLAQIAAVPADQRRATRTFTIRNRNAEDLRGSLSRLLGVSLGGAGETLPASNQPELAAGGDRASQTSSASRGSADLLLAVDPVLNAIIAVGSPQPL